MSCDRWWVVLAQHVTCYWSMDGGRNFLQNSGLASVSRDGLLRIGHIGDYSRGYDRQYQRRIFATTQLSRLFYKDAPHAV